jgi:hypothetical protein
VELIVVVKLDTVPVFENCELPPVALLYQLNVPLIGEDAPTVIEPSPHLLA